MKKLASVVCMMALAWHIGVRPSLAAGTEPPRDTAERPLAAAIAAAGHNYNLLLPQAGSDRINADRERKIHDYNHLRSQTGSNRISADRQLKIALAAAIGFGVGFGSVYLGYKDGGFDRYEQEVAITTGATCAGVAGFITYKLTGP